MKEIEEERRMKLDTNGAQSYGDDGVDAAPFPSVSDRVLKCCPIPFMDIF